MNRKVQDKSDRLVAHERIDPLLLQPQTVWLNWPATAVFLRHGVFGGSAASPCRRTAPWPDGHVLCWKANLPPLWESTRPPASPKLIFRMTPVSHGQNPVGAFTGTGV